MKQLIEDLISALEYHVEQTRPIHSTTVAIQAAREALAKQDGQSNFCPQCEALGRELRAIKQTGKGQSCCAECGKKESDGFALYCVECMDKINSYLKQEQDSTCNKTLHAQGKAYPRTCKKCGLAPCVGETMQEPTLAQGVKHDE